MFPKKFLVLVFLVFLFLFSPKNLTFNNSYATSDPGAYVMEITKNAIDTLTNESVDIEKKNPNLENYLIKILMCLQYQDSF